MIGAGRNLPRPLAAAAAPPVTLPAINVTINGVPTDKAPEVSRQVSQALRKELRDFLAVIKDARAFESRVGYV
jgi:hypothetical protein